MAKLRHIAIATNDPKTTAEFYKKASASTRSAKPAHQARWQMAIS